MTEQEWLTSDDPQKMYAFIVDASIAIRGNPMTERQQRFFVDACVQLWEATDSTRVIYEFRTSLMAWIKLPVFRQERADLLREIIGNPFRPMAFKKRKCNHSFVPSPNGEDRCRFVLSDDGNWGQSHCNMPRIFHSIMLDPAWLTWNNATIPNLIRSMMEEECDICHGGKGRNYCSHCNGKGYVPRAEPQWETMLLIADALEEAGCTEAAILDHLRGTEPCPYCTDCKMDVSDLGTPFLASLTPEQRERGKRYFKQVCSCKGTGKRPVRHVRGCWAVELLTGGML